MQSTAVFTWKAVYPLAWGDHEGLCGGREDKKAMLFLAYIAKNSE
jgi:hypothetical protein